MNQLVDLSQGCQVLASPKGKPFVFVKPVDADQVFVSFYASEPDPAQIASEAWPNAGGIQFTVVPGDYSSCDIPAEAMDGAQLNPKVVKFPSSDFVCPVPGTVITDSDGVSYITIVPILAKSLCETACISENELAAGDMVLSCVDGKLTLKKVNKPIDPTIRAELNKAGDAYVVDTSMTALNGGHTKTVEYSIDDGKTWVDAGDVDSLPVDKMPDGGLVRVKVSGPDGEQFDVVKVDKPCAKIAESTFVVRCIASGGNGTPFDGVHVDGSLVTGNGPRKIEYLPEDDASSPLSDAPWILHSNDDSGLISDAELVETGGYIRVGVETSCGWQYAVQKVDGCCGQGILDRMIGSSTGRGAFCLSVSPSGELPYIRVDSFAGNPEYYTDPAGNPYASLTVTNTANCPKKIHVESRSTLHRGGETSPGAGIGTEQVQLSALVQARLGHKGDPLLDSQSFDTAYANYSGPWITNRSVDESYSGRFVMGSHSVGGGRTGTVTTTNNSLDLVIPPGESVELVEKIHVYYEIPDAAFSSNERLHFDSAIQAWED